MDVAYDRALRAAKRAFWDWHPSKRDDAQAEFMGKVWDQWWRLLERGKRPRAAALFLAPLGEAVGPI